MYHKQKIIQLIEADAMRLRALSAVRSLGLKDCLIAAGFVRNLIWDHICGTTTALDDIDVIYFDLTDCTSQRDHKLETKLKKIEADLPWSVKNQARMHIRNNDQAYKSTLDAMSFWPEKQTCIGVKLDDHDQLVIQHCFDLVLQFNVEINHNPKRSFAIFEKRIRDKKWKKKWPALYAVND